MRDAAGHLINGQKVNIASVPALVCWALTSSYSLWMRVLGASPSVTVHFSVLALCFNGGLKLNVFFFFPNAVDECSFHTVAVDSRDLLFIYQIKTDKTNTEINVALS